MSQHCVICGFLLKSNIVTVKKKGISRLIKASQEREDGLESTFKGMEEVLLHGKCRMSYIKESCILTHRKRKHKEILSDAGEESDQSRSDESAENSIENRSSASPEIPIENSSSESPEKLVEHNSSDTKKPKKHRLSSSEEATETSSKFDFTKFCFFCNEHADEAFVKAQKKYPLDKRITVKEVKRPETQNKILQLARTHGDQWSRQVIQRIEDVDLISVNAKYHSKCYLSFYGKPKESSSKKGRPINPEVELAIGKIIAYLKAYPNECHTYKEILDVGGLPMDIRTMLNNLIRRNVNFITVTACPSLLMLREVRDHILYKSWQASEKKQPKNQDEQAQRSKIIENAAFLLRDNIKTIIDDAVSIPEISMFLETDIPQTLRLFFLQLTNKQKNKLSDDIVSICHTIFTEIHKSMNCNAQSPSREEEAQPLQTRPDEPVFSENDCFICGLKTDEELQTIIKSDKIMLAAGLRKHNIEGYFIKTGVTDLRVHYSCCTAYTNIIKNPPKKKSKQNTEIIPKVEFTYNTMCLLCDKGTTEVSEHIAIKKPETKLALETIAEIRNECFADKILNRIQVDLPSVDGWMHRRCYNTFRNLRTIYNSNGPIPKFYNRIAMKQVFSYVDDYDELLSLDTGFKRVISLLYEQESVLRLIKIENKDESYIVTETQPQLICSKDYGSRLISQNWRSSFSEDDEQEKLEDICAGVSVILEDIKKGYDDVPESVSCLVKNMLNVSDETEKPISRAIVALIPEDDSPTAKRAKPNVVHSVLGSGYPLDFEF